MSAPGAATVPMKPAAPIAFTSRIDAFDKSSVLTPQVLGFFLDRMSAAAAANAAPVRPAVESVRAGKFDEAKRALRTPPVTISSPRCSSRASSCCRAAI